MKDQIKSIRFPLDLVELLQEDAEQECRTFSRQVVHIVKRHYERELTNRF